MHGYTHVAFKVVQHHHDKVDDHNDAELLFK